MDNDIKRILLYNRTAQSTYTAQVVEFPIGSKAAVALIAIHWSLEQACNATASHLFMLALSENPDHLLNPPVGVAETMGNPALYGMATFSAYAEANGSGYAWEHEAITQIVPLYGMLRPKRQVVIFANIWGAGLCGVRGEIFYKEVMPPMEVINAMNRRYGKYRRS